MSMIQTSCGTTASSGDGYDAFLAHVSESFLDICGDGGVPLFTTDVEGLWGLYLDGFADPADRQHHTCHACRHFIERFGGLVTIDALGRTASATWREDGTPEHFRPAVAAMAKAVSRARVTGVFLSSDKTWGTPTTGAWHHLAVRPPTVMRLRRALLTAGQAMAEKREDFRTVVRALEEFTLPHLDTALTLLKTDALYRSEKVLGQAEWLRDLHVARAEARATKANVVWRAVATAPAGFCHPRSSMIGTLLEDIAAGKDYDDVARAFAAKMHPLAYQRPQAAPTAGAIAAAEKVFQQMGAAGALARRFARVDEVQALWRPAPPKAERPAGGGVFGHLQPKGSTPPPAMRIPAQTVTWSKFEATVLPTAERIELLAPMHDNYAALVTAVDPDAPPILQWDREDARNPVSWYVWNGGSPASQWGLRAGQFHEVSAVTLKPSMWGGGCEHQGKGVLFLIAAAQETRNAGAALFPEILKSEFHGVRSVIEAYSRGATIEGISEPHAAGLMLAAGSSWNVTVRVWVAGRPLDYRMDRWD